MLTLDTVSLTLGSFTLKADFSIAAGEIAAVIGPSGAGKSTLFSLIAGFLTPDHGRILWEGQNLAEFPPGKRPVSMIFQDQNLFPHLNVAQNVGLGLRADLRLSEDQHQRVGDVLEQVGLAGFGTRKPASLSGGQQSRVAVARVLLRNRPLLLLDEPFSALGPALKNEMLDLVASLSEKAGATVLMITHDPRDALRIADTTIRVENGIAHPPAPTADILNNPSDSLRAYLGQI